MSRSQVSLAMMRFCLAFVWMLSVIECQVVPDNPCPNIFAYRQQRGGYYGEIVIPYDGSKNLDLSVNISMPGLYQSAKVKLDLLTPAENILSTPVLRYRVNFPFQNVVPRITQIMFNERIFCYGPSEPLSPNGVTNLWANIVFKINEYTYNIQSGFKDPINNPFSTNNLSSFNEPVSNPFVDTQPVVLPPTSPTNLPTTPPKVSTAESCGVANDIQTLVVRGDSTIDNEYPWLVALFHRLGVSYVFQCTANLISERHVITAAHCVWYYRALLVDKKEDVLLVLGRSDISRWASSGAIIRTALEITPHPSYKQDSGHCDVAVIKLNEPVTFKPTIRPICLWESDTNLKRITGAEGTVAGWGKSEENGVAVAKPRKVAMPVVSQEECLRSHSDFKKLTSEKTFCAGNKDGSGPCSGDSGAGFMVKKNGKWFLRGLVSTAIKNEDYSCNLNEYIVFSDIAKLSDWIKSAMT